MKRKGLRGGGDGTVGRVLTLPLRGLGFPTSLASTKESCTGINPRHGQAEAGACLIKSVGSRDTTSKTKLENEEGIDA